MKIRIWGLKKSRMMRMIRLKKYCNAPVQAFRISFEQSPKKAKQDHGKARESDVIDVEFEEFCKAIEANLSIEQMVEILEVKDQDSSGTNPVVVTKWEMPIVNWNLMVKDILAKECTLIKKSQMTRKWDEKLGFEEDKGSEDNHNHNQNNTNNATMDSCGEDCVEVVIVEKAGECLSLCLDNKDSSTDKMDREAKLPFCVALEIWLWCAIGYMFEETSEEADLSEHLSKHCLARWMKWLVNQWSNVA
ncbi:hypothetical protein Pint_21360 [Pistacia integerrima]|uniref:Uncharacterized protein n=1 Tax=Pistacia integerrima TaxID=434235 RepID=A0ACC0XDF3_9ROSI|nr:hypothetical protein Pint_21360 [Pistacia integerrima]